ncbi:acyltransferase family protein [Leclercia sp.]|uniref:acyltransferase family protein n=1 Tax=Leclercia sp. TaxID=1898428 RepID=UPI0039173CC0
MLIPILSSFKNSYGDEGILTLFGVWFIFGCITPLVSDVYQLNSVFITNYNLNQISGVAGYAITGVAIHSFMRLRPNVLLCVLLVIICNALTACFTFSYSHESGSTYQAFYSYTSPLVAIAAICMTLACLKIYFPTIPVLLSKLISLVSSVSLGVYCIHMFVFTTLDILYSDYIGPKANIMTYFVVFMSIAVLIGSVILSLLLKKIPYLNKCV